MSYMINVRRGAPWFDKTFDPIFYGSRGRSRLEACDAWTREYGYPISCDKFGFAHKVVFPNEGEAVLFVLRWS